MLAACAQSTATRSFHHHQSTESFQPGRFATIGSAVVSPSATPTTNAGCAKLPLTNSIDPVLFARRTLLRSTPSAAVTVVIDEQSRIPTKEIATFKDLEHGMQRPTSEGVKLTDVSVELSRAVSSSPTILFSDLEKDPECGQFRQTAFEWTGYSVSFGKERSVVFKSLDERDEFYKAVTQTLASWRDKYKNVK